MRDSLGAARDLVDEKDELLVRDSLTSRDSNGQKLTGGDTTQCGKQVRGT